MSLPRVMVMDRENKVGPQELERDEYLSPVSRLSSL